ncbi:GNAT family N-acetyltransferase [Paenibacillus senegalensis]|uniref:GNAT family N-acetyltransferase n=1 Tax=Paenibacillus senegalensis TaxID=1465766 RepID=UPI0002895500|nr:GNAT family N-acetyltransferase [Paenibacillus senegalensis]
MIIRQYTIEDIPQLIKMRFDFTAESKKITADLYEPFYTECLEFFDEIKASGRWRIWVAEVGGAIVSHIYVQIIDTVPRPGRRKSPWGYMTNVYTLPAYRSRGIGGRILEEINTWAKTYGLTFLTVWPSEESVEFYSRHGFERAGEAMENHLKS